MLKEEHNHNAFNVISSKYNIKYDTLKQKYFFWLNNVNNYLEKENRGGHNKLFKDDEEHDLVDYIKNIFIDGNLIFTNEHL